MDYPDIGSRMKSYENVESKRALMPLLPILARLDGKNFSTFTKKAGVKKPFDIHFYKVMLWTARALVEEFQPSLAYIYSDEISLVWYLTDSKQDMIFGGRVHKLCSILAGHAAVVFNRLLQKNQEERLACGDETLKLEDAPLVFDCRVWNVPIPMEAVNVFIWRELDASKNSLQSLSRSKFSHAELHNKNNSELHEMLIAQGVNWNDLPDFFKRGCYIQRFKEDNTTKYRMVSLQLLKVENKVEFVLFGEEPTKNSYK